MIWRRIALILASIGLTCVAPASATGATREAADTSGSAQQILVLLRPAPQHYRPNSNYGGSYGDNLARSARHRLANRIARQHGLTLLDDWPMPLLGLDCFVMSVPHGQSVTQVAEQVSRDPAVVFAQPMHAYEAEGGGPPYNDPLFKAQPSTQEWRVADLHRVASGRGITVAVIDSQIEDAHPDLAGQIAVDRNFAPGPALRSEQHGTGIAGIIAAKANNGQGIVGLAPHARLMGLRACWQVGDGPAAATTVCDTLSLAKALHFAIERRADVINLSFSGPPDLLLGRLLEVGLRRGISIVAAFDNRRAGGGFPASQPGVIPVEDESLAAPPARVYTAPGRDVLTTQPGGRWYLVNGSSYAAAHVSGLLALIRERRPFTHGPVLLVSAGATGGRIDASASLLGNTQACGHDCASASRRPSGPSP
jgi:hypothetical protein